jgi:hypothetical protein
MGSPTGQGGQLSHERVKAGVRLELTMPPRTRVADFAVDGCTANRLRAKRLRNLRQVNASIQALCRVGFSP